jgi:hypothetical protein
MGATIFLLVLCKLITALRETHEHILKLLAVLLQIRRLIVICYIHLTGPLMSMASLLWLKVRTGVALEESVKKRHVL